MAINGNGCSRGEMAFKGCRADVEGQVHVES